MNETLRDPKEKPFVGDPLRGLVEQLKDAHGDLPDEQIRDVAKHSLDRFAKARIRSFVPVLAWRHAQPSFAESRVTVGSAREAATASRSARRFGSRRYGSWYPLVDGRREVVAKHGPTLGLRLRPG
jgi:hypothetical protein